MTQQSVSVTNPTFLPRFQHDHVSRVHPSNGMGKHRILITRVRRGIAHWPVAAALFVALIVLGLLGWTWLNGTLNHQAETEVTTCHQGDAVLRVAAAPTLASQLRDAAQHWTDQHPIIYDQCIKVEVQAVNPATIVDGLTATWDSTKLGQKPDAWMPDSNTWVTKLSTSKPTLVQTQPASSDLTLVVLAGDWIGSTQLKAAQQLRDFLKQPDQQRLFANVNAAPVG